MKWKAEGRPLEAGPARGRARTHFTPRVDQALIADVNDIKGYLENGGAQVVDARPAARFLGEEAEPRPGLRKGHMPGSKNLPYTCLINPDGTLKSADQISQAFSDAGVDVSAPIATTCGSGVTASILALALSKIGRLDASVYDASWAEWGKPDSGLPVVNS